MAVVLINKEYFMKNVVSLCLFFFSAQVLAGGGDDQSAGRLALADFSKSLVAVESQIQACKQQKQLLPYQQIQALKLSKASLKTAIAYHYFNADYLCNKPAIGEYLISSAVLAQVTPNTPQTPEFKKGLQAADNLVSSLMVQMLKAKVDYLALPEEERLALAKVEALRKPFDLFTAVDALGL